MLIRLDALQSLACVVLEAYAISIALCLLSNIRSQAERDRAGNQNLAITKDKDT